MANEGAAGGGLFGLFPQNTNDYALSYLSEKYGQTFSYLGPWGDSMSGTRSFLASCEALPGQRILVQVENFRDEGSRTVRDNYLACLYASVNLFYEPALLPLAADLPADASFERFLAEGGAFLSVTMELRPSEWQNEEQARALIQRIADSGVSCSLNLIALPEEQFGTLSREELKTRISTRDFVRYAMASCSGGSCKLNFREGSA